MTTHIQTASIQRNGFPGNAASPTLRCDSNGDPLWIVRVLRQNLPQASYVVKSSQMVAEAERLAQLRATLHQKIQADGKRVATDDLVQTLRVLSRSHRRFTEEQKTKVFRSVVKEARVTAAGVELELYVQPTQNVWWKYRQKKNVQRASNPIQTIRIHARAFATAHR